MGGFTRRYTNYPSQQQIQLIEGVVIVDLPVAGAPQGVGTGVVGFVGEFSDMTFALALDKSTGSFTSFPQPVQIFGSADMLQKLGGFDETIGEFGNTGGNGFVKLRNKKLAGLVVVPVNLASQYGVRLFRQLPTNASATNPTPAVPMSPALVAAGTEFKTTTNRVRVCQSVPFTGDASYDSGTDGSVTAAGAATTGTFTSVGGDFVNKGVKKGDVLVLGVIGAAGAQGANAFTFRVTAITDATDLVVEKMDGSSFTWTSGTTLAWRLHTGTTADSFGAGNAIADANQLGCLVPARPLDATVVASTVLTPTVAQPSPTATTWSPLSGLSAITGSNSVIYTAAVQGPNVTVGAALEALYTNALASLLADQPPSNQVDIVLVARTSTVIRAAQKAHVELASSQGLGRTSPISPALKTDNSISTQSTSNILSNASPGVGAARSERADYNWPGVQEFIPEAVGFTVGTADGGSTTSGVLDVTSDSWLACIMSNLASEQDPAQTTDAVGSLTAPILGFQRGAPALDINAYIALKQGGVCAVKQEPNGFFFQSGVTTSLTSGQTDITRRRFADEVEDSLAAILKPYAKQNLTQALRDTEMGQVVDYLSGLLSLDNAAAQRIEAFAADDKSGNTQQSLAAGYNVIKVAVQMLPEQKEIVIVAQVGPTVNVTANVG